MRLKVAIINKLSLINYCCLSVENVRVFCSGLEILGSMRWGFFAALVISSWRRPCGTCCPSVFGPQCWTFLLHHKLPVSEFLSSVSHLLCSPPSRCHCGSPHLYLGCRMGGWLFRINSFYMCRCECLSFTNVRPCLFLPWASEHWSYSLLALEATQTLLLGSPLTVILFPFCRNKYCVRHILPLKGEAAPFDIKQSTSLL